MSDHDCSFGALLKAFRKRQRLTQQALSEAIGVHRGTLIRWEQGDYLPDSKAMVLELARHLKLDDQETCEFLEASLTGLPPHWSVPFPRNLFFTGREEVLEMLHTQLGVGRAVALTQSLALHGLGGVGKTQIALEYAYRHALDYNAVFWIGAETDEQVVASFLHIAERLHLPEREEKDQQRVVAAVQHWLRAHGQWLLIWDNVEDLELLPRFLPPTRSGAILLTTRCQILGTLTRGLDLVSMKQEEGVLFLLRRAKVLSPEATDEQWHQMITSNSDEYRAATALVQILEGLPLALDQAGAYVEETGCCLLDYLHRYEQYRSSLLDRRGGLITTHPHSVTMTFRLLMERMEREQPAAVDILRICCLLHADAIPEELFVEGAAHLGPRLSPMAADLYRFDQVIVSLRNLSLIQRQPQMRTFSLHRLVQAVLKETLDTAAAHYWSEHVIQALAAVFPDPDFRNWIDCERLVPHILMVLPIVEQGSITLPEARDLFSRTGSYLLERGRYAEAERVLMQAGALGEQERQRSDPQIAYTLDRLATLYWRQGKYQQAEPLFQRALAISEECLGPTHFNTSSYLNNLAQLYYEQGNYKQAESIQQRALAIMEGLLDPLHPDLAQTLDSLAQIMGAQGKDIQAEGFYRRALSIWERQPDPAHPHMTFCLNNLGNLYLEQGKYDLAEPFFKQALAIRQQTLGETHPRTATSLHNLARLYLRQGKYEVAMQLSQRAVLILEQQVGSENSYFARALENLGAISMAQSNYEQAEHLFLRTLSIQEQVLGSSHPETARTLHDLTLLRKAQGRMSEALIIAEQALKAYTQSLGNTHPKTIATHTLYTQLLQIQGSSQGKMAAALHVEEGPDPRRKEPSLPLQKTVYRSCSGNDPLQGFLDACCELHQRAWCRSADLWQAYQQWVEKQQERYPLSRRAFITQLKRHGCWADRTMVARIWRGIALVTKES